MKWSPTFASWNNMESRSTFSSHPISAKQHTTHCLGHMAWKLHINTKKTTQVLKQRTHTDKQFGSILTLTRWAGRLPVLSTARQPRSELGHLAQLWSGRKHEWNVEAQNMQVWMISWKASWQRKVGLRKFHYTTIELQKWNQTYSVLILYFLQCGHGTCRNLHSVVSCTVVTRPRVPRCWHPRGLKTHDTIRPRT